MNILSIISLSPPFTFTTEVFVIDTSVLSYPQIFGQPNTYYVIQGSDQFTVVEGSNDQSSIIRG